MARIFNFAAGPATLPAQVLAQARDELLDWQGSGLSVLELPFTSPEFRVIQERAEADLRALLAIPDDYRVLFLQGGAYAHAALLAQNLLGGRRADYVETGHWSRRAAGEAERYGRVDIAASGAASGFTAIPPQEQWRLNPSAVYCHITSNETADGVQFHWIPDTGAVPLIADMTSDILSRPVDVRRYGLIYASAQKNIGPAGLTLVIVRETLLAQAPAALPAVFAYGCQAAAGSRVNTPPTFAVYLTGLVLQWLHRQGGLAEMARRNRDKSRRLYAAIDASGGFYRCPVALADRSWMNVRFHLPDDVLTTAFLAEAEAHGLRYLRGHGAVGGIRASLYNAMPEAGVEALIGFMADFAERHRDRI
ncbi:MAG TPA: 3-phosphoserine/phosphohydroxythreonine transaminase [Candidatus Competibacteraceae bacterium]|nr:3-phosphoserine/phosphohydroxythreonine transaminase [Candidatus Competibacteraceae bacterium]